MKIFLLFESNETLITVFLHVLSLQPGAIFKESECKTCQCIDNVYVCDDEQCEKIEKVTVPKESKNVSHSVLIIQSTVTPPAKCEPEKLVCS